MCLYQCLQYRHTIQLSDPSESEPQREIIAQVLGYFFNPCMKYVKYAHLSRLLKDTKTTASIFSLYLTDNALTMCDGDEIFNCVANKCCFLNCFAIYMN